MRKYLLQGFLIVLGLILLFRFAVPGVYLAGEWVMGSEGVSNAHLDNEVRFLSVLAGGFSILAFWLVSSIEHKTVPFYLLLGTTFAGGLARVLSFSLSGIPETSALIATSIELVSPVILFFLHRSGIAHHTEVIHEA